MVKKYWCDELNKTLTCNHDGIVACCSGKQSPIYIKDYKGEKISKKAFLKIKKQTFDLLNEKDIHKTDCESCFYLRERQKSDVISDKFNMLHINHWLHCNCGCIYCARMRDSKGEITETPKKSDYYDMKPLLKDLYKNDLLDKKNLKVCIQGGDISVLEEFEDIVEELLKEGVSQITILSNNIKYQPIIKKLLQLGKINFMTSLDCATPEIYHKLKRVDKFNDCVENLRKYAEGIEHPPIIVKYIVVEHINDNKEEIKKFIDLMDSIGIKNLEFMIDNKWALFTNLEETPYPAYFGDLYLYFKNLCEEKGINFFIWDKVEQDLNKYVFKK